MKACPQCQLVDGMYRDDLIGKLQCDNCGWYEGKKLELPVEPETETVVADDGTTHTLTTGIPLCDPVFWSSAEDAMIHLTCETHGDTVVGYGPTMLEVSNAYYVHCRVKP